MSLAGNVAARWRAERDPLGYLFDRARAVHAIQERQKGVTALLRAIDEERWGDAFVLAWMLDEMPREKDGHLPEAQAMLSRLEKSARLLAGVSAECDARLRQYGAGMAAEVGESGSAELQDDEP